MPKPRYKTTKWKQYTLIDRGSLTFWVDEEAIAEWKQNTHTSSSAQDSAFVTHSLSLKHQKNAHSPH